MNDTAFAAAPVRWTWADLFSTYRFWALLILYVASTLCISLMTLVAVQLRDRLFLTASDFGLLFAVRGYGVIFALWLAWIAVRWKTKPMLLALAVLQLAGFSLLVFPGADASFVVRVVGAFFWGTGYFALILAIAALLAGSLGGTENFVVAFGVLFTIATLVQISTPELIGAYMLANFGATFVMYYMLFVFLVGIVVLLPARGTFFHEAPPARGYSFSPASRSPLAAALLFAFVPFYVFYWLYKVHGEVASIAPSRALLSPRAAIGISFVPLMGPLMLTTVVDEINRGAASKGLPRLRSPWAIFFLMLFLPPVAIGLVQSALNRAASAFSQQPPVGAL